MCQTGCWTVVAAAWVLPVGSALRCNDRAIEITAVGASWDHCWAVESIARVSG